MATQASNLFNLAFAGTPVGDPDLTIDLAVRAERCGFDGFYLADLPQGLGTLPLLVAIARATTQIRLGPFVLNTGWWTPALAVRELATLDRLSGGRLEIGIGSGIPHAGLEEPLRSQPGARYRRLEQTVEALEAALRNPEGRPGFLQQRPRLTIAVTGERALRLAARHADTFVIAGVPPVPQVALPPGEQILPSLAATERQLERLRTEAGPRAGQIAIGTGAPVILTDDRDAWAEEKARIHTYLSPAEILGSPKVIVGNVEQVVDRLLDYEDRLGLTSYVLRSATGPEALVPVLDLVRRRVGQTVA